MIAFPKIEFPRTDAVLRSLPNGLEIVVKEDSSAPVISAQAWVRTGSCFEEDLLGSGVSHLLEHMVFKGSADRGPSELARAVQAVGGFLNAYTSFERTVYYVDAPVEGAEAVLDVLADLVSRAVFPEDEFEKEKDVIRREIDMGEDDPDTKNSHVLFETVFRVHPMGQPIIGHLDLFDRVTRAQMIEYYQTHYVPNNMFLVVAGPLEPERVEQMLAARFKSLPRGRHRLGHLPAEPEQLGRREAHIEFVTDLSKLNLAWRVPGLTHPDVPALEVLAEILGQGRSSRLYRRIREGRRLAHGIGATCYIPPLGGIFSIYSDLDFENCGAVRDEALAIIEEIKREGVSLAEVVKAQRMVLGEQLEGLTTTRGLASDLGSSWHVARNLDFTADMLESIERVSPDQVQEVARKYLVERGLTITSLNPTGSLSKTNGSRNKPSPGKVEKFVLKNGMTVLVREDHRVPLITLHATLRGGSLAETGPTAGLSRLLSRAILKGTPTRTADQISGLLEESGGGISSDSGGSSWALSVDVLKPDLALGLDVLADVLLYPTFPEEAVAREKEAQVASIRADANRLTSVAFRHLRETLFGPHPFALERNGTAKSLARLDAAKVRTFHQQLVVSGNLVLAAFGAVNTKEVIRLVEQLFADLPAGGRIQSPAAAGFAPGFSTTEKDVVKRKKQAVLAIGYPTIDLLHPDRVPLDLLDEACSDMASRLFLRIREAHGLAYYTGAFQILGMAPGAFTFYLGTAPERLEQAQAELLDEIRILARDGLAEDELERVKKSWLGKHLIHQQGSDNLARTAALDELYGVGFDFHEQLAARVRAMTAREVRSVAQKYFGDQPHAIIRVTPQTGRGEASSGTLDAVDVER
ncbi:MAG: M16 family metallopeptidase [Verrucomicrobiales bacterium]